MENACPEILPHLLLSLSPLAKLLECLAVERNSISHILIVCKSISSAPSCAKMGIVFKTVRLTSLLFFSIFRSLQAVVKDNSLLLNSLLENFDFLDNARLHGNALICCEDVESQKTGSALAVSYVMRCVAFNLNKISYRFFSRACKLSVEMALGRVQKECAAVSPSPNMLMHLKVFERSGMKLRPAVRLTRDVEGGSALFWRLLSPLGRFIFISIVSFGSGVLLLILGGVFFGTNGQGSTAEDWYDG